MASVVKYPTREVRGTGPYPYNYRVINSLIHAGAQYGVRRISGDLMELGTSRPGATAHQDSRRSWLPIRTIIDIGPADVAEWKSIVLEHAVESVKGLA